VESLGTAGPVGGQRPTWSLVTRYRTIAFAVLFTAAVVALGPALARALVTGFTQAQPLLTALSVVSVAGLFVVASALAGAIAKQVSDPVSGLRRDVRRASVAEANGRRGDTHLSTTTNEPEEVARLREQVSALHAVMQSRIDAEQRWLGAAAHDVKAGLVGLAHLLEASHDVVARADRAGAAGLALARDEARRLVDVLARLTDLVRFARIEAIDRKRFDLGDVVARIAERHQESPANDERVELRVERQGVAPVVGDEVLIERAISNLVDNAVRVARSHVTLTVYRNLVRVEDDGPGLPEEIEELTQPFRSDDVTISGVEVPGGTLGLGLFISRQVLEAHGGRLVVERTSKEGTAMLAYVGSKP
jgi:signal transduction histidine kinase